MNGGRTAAILLGLLTCFLAASLLCAEPKRSQGPQSDDPKEQVLNLEQEWIVAEHNRDEATLRRILHDKFIASFGAGKPHDKESFVKSLLSSPVDPTETQTLTDRTVIIENDTAIIVGTDTERGTRKGAVYTAVARYTATYIRRDGHWLALAEHMVELPQAK